MNRARTLLVAFLVGIGLTLPLPALGDETPRFMIELEAGPTWQSRNDVQVPNDDTGTRFSLADLAGNSPLPAARLYVTWNLSERHGLRLLLAPLSYTRTGSFEAPVDFAGERYQPGTATDGTYRFNSWRVGYRYLLGNGDRWKVWIGLTVKIRDAKIELRQGEVTSRDTDVGFVPLLHFAASWRAGDRWSLMFDFEGLAGGPGRALDAALRIGYDVSDRWRLALGYRVLEGGVDIDQVYNFAWFNGATATAAWRF